MKPKNTVWSKYGFLWVALGLFALSLLGHWIFAWYAFVDEQLEHRQSPEVQAFVIQTTGDTLENWQSEFLHLVVAGERSGIALPHWLAEFKGRQRSSRRESRSHSPGSQQRLQEGDCDTRSCLPARLINARVYGCSLLGSPVKTTILVAGATAGILAVESGCDGVAGWRYVRYVGF
jgi:hypothetical protein